VAHRRHGRYRACQHARTPAVDRFTWLAREQAPGLRLDRVWVVRASHGIPGDPGHSVDPARWQELSEELLGRFGRVEPRRHARAFVRGLLADRPRKNCWTIAEHAGDPTPDGMQHLHALAPLGVTLAHYALLLASPRRLEIVAPHVTDSWAVSSRV
jgi:hypothetical protein